MAPALAGQRPTVSPALQRADTTVVAWLFARPGRDLAEVRRLVAAGGGTVRRTSGWLHAVSARLTPAALDAARRSPLLRHLQPVAVFRGPAAPDPAPVAALAAGPDSAFGPSASPLRTLRAFPLIERGRRGAGVRIALLDTGFETTLPAFAGVTVAGQHDFVFNDGVVRNEPGDTATASDHGTAVWSLLAANVADSLVGLAPDAEYLLAKTEDVRREVRLEEDNFVAALEWADSLGADLVSTSLGYRNFDDGSGYPFTSLNGDLAVTTIAADMAAARGMVVVASIGNTGPAFRTLTTPADGDSVIAVGATDTLGQLASFSGRGPTADGRLKPDVVAPGSGILVQTPAGLSRQNGTSFATPLIAGLAALMLEAHPTFGPIDVRDALRRAGTNAGQPDSARGWGIPDGFEAVVFPRGLVVDRLADSVLPSVTPVITWRAPDVPAFAGAPVYRIVVSRDSTLANPRLDSTLVTEQLTLPYVLRPDELLYYRVTATAADSAQVTAQSGGRLVGPAWATLENLNAPAGSTIRDLRPLFDWSAPAISAARGPLVFRVEVIRDVDGILEIAEDSLTVTEWSPPRDLERNTPYRWRVIARIGPDSVTVNSAGPFLIVDDSTPAITTLFQNFPNPFPNPAIGRTTTCLWFDLANEGVVELAILDMRGLVLRRLLPTGGFGPFLRAGRYGRPSSLDSGQCDPELQWDGRTDGGSLVPAGVYLARLRTPDGIFVRRIVFLGTP